MAVKWEVFAISVEADAEDRTIVLRQDEHVDASCVVVRPEQVDLLIEMLKKAKVEAEGVEDE